MGTLGHTWEKSMRPRDEQGKGLTGCASPSRKASKVKGLERGAARVLTRLRLDCELPGVRLPVDGGHLLLRG